MILASSVQAARALELVRALQRRMVAAQEALAHRRGAGDHFVEVTWLRDEGRHGGGTRCELADTAIFDRASVNVSQVHYDDLARDLSSATALSTIIHPRHPQAPSVHVHVSWTELRAGQSYWRIMADLNPAIPRSDDTARFTAALAAAAGPVHAAAARQGDRYFYIPALGRHRGVSHFYLEQHATADPDADHALARAVAAAAIDTHAAIVAGALDRHGAPSSDERAAQLAYHTLYFFQVLSLDRGTTSGLLVHDQNDVGILGSLPSQVDRKLIASWRSRVPSPLDQLVDQLLAALPPGDGAVLVDADTKRRLASCVRAFYRVHPRAIELQARGDVVPPTVQNHRA